MLIRGVHYPYRLCNSFLYVDFYPTKKMETQMILFYDRTQGWEIYRLRINSGIFKKERYYHWIYWYETYSYRYKWNIILVKGAVQDIDSPDTMWHRRSIFLEEDLSPTYAGGVIILLNQSFSKRRGKLQAIRKEEDTNSMNAHTEESTLNLSKHNFVTFIVCISWHTFWIILYLIYCRFYPHPHVVITRGCFILYVWIIKKQNMDIAGSVELNYLFLLGIDVWCTMGVIDLKHL